MRNYTLFRVITVQNPGIMVKSNLVLYLNEYDDPDIPGNATPSNNDCEVVYLNDPAQILTMLKDARKGFTLLVLDVTKHFTGKQIFRDLEVVRGDESYSVFLFSSSLDTPVKKIVLQYRSAPDRDLPEQYLIRLSEYLALICQDASLPSVSNSQG